MTARAPGTRPARAADPPATASMTSSADPRALRLTVAPASRADGDPVLTIVPALATIRPMLDGQPIDARLEQLDPMHAVLVEGEVDGAATRTRLIMGTPRRRDADGTTLREVVVDGWRIEVELVSERRASLRERARRGHDVAGRGGPIEVRAIIPGRIVALSVAPGDAVIAGQQVLVLEAMKMQNELRAPRDGGVERVAAAVGENVEVGDLLLVIS